MTNNTKTLCACLIVLTTVLLACTAIVATVQHTKTPDADSAADSTALQEMAAIQKQEAERVRQHNAMIRGKIRVKAGMLRHYGDTEQWDTFMATNEEIERLRGQLR